MKKIVIILILCVLAIYFFTGRYHEVYRNVSDRGFVALWDEPYWLSNLCNEQISRLQSKFNNAIDGKKIGPPDKT